MAKDTTPSSLPRGTRVLTRAFFQAANGFPEATRPALVKAALAAIRDDLKTAREKATAAKTKAKAPPKKAAAKGAAKLAPRRAPASSAKKAVASATQPKKTPSKKASPKKSAAKSPTRVRSDKQAAIEAADVAETTSPEVVQGADE
jgi:hypothetical protein